MKEKKKALKAQAINEAQKMFSVKLDKAHKLADDLSRLLSIERKASDKLRKELRDLKAENDELKLKLGQYEEWLERMQEFCNLPEGERKQAYETYVKQKREESVGVMYEWDKQFEGFLSLFGL